MKKMIHPQTYDVVFTDVSSQESFLTTTTMTSNETILWTDGKTYPHIKVDISNSSHPFFSGKERKLDAESRAEKFKKKYDPSLLLELTNAKLTTP